MHHEFAGAIAMMAGVQCLVSSYPRFHLIFDHHDSMEVVRSGCFGGTFSLSDIVHVSLEGVQIDGVRSGYCSSWDVVWSTSRAE